MEDDPEFVRGNASKLGVWVMVGLLLTIAVGVPLAVVVKGIFGPSHTLQVALQDVRDACLVDPSLPTDYPPALDSRMSYGDTLTAYRTAEVFAAAAARDDPQWISLKRA